jgi:hypothetical protein
VKPPTDFSWSRSITITIAVVTLALRPVLVAVAPATVITTIFRVQGG